MWPVVILAAWRLRRTWFLLLFIAFGMVAAVVIVCTIPLLSSVMTTAGLRSTLRATPESDEIVVYGGGPGISTSIVQAANNKFAPLFRRYLGNTVQQTQFSATTNDFSLSPQRKNTTLVVYGTAMQLAATHFGKVDGRVARVTDQPVREIEVMMTPATAKRLGMPLGSTFTLSLTYFTATPATSDTLPTLYSATITVHLVGLFQVTPSNLAYWHGDDFSPLSLANAGSTTQYQYTLVVPADALLTLFDRLRALHQTDAIYAFSSGGYAFAWYYHIPPSPPEVIALLRSRGASSRQIFGALFLQSVVLSLIALFIGIPLAVWATLLLAGHTLTGNELDALNVITAHPLQVMTGVMPYALLIILVALITMGLSLLSAARLDVLSLRRASARSATRPFWQRYNLDLIAGVLALLGYGLSFYVSSVGNVLQGDARTLIATLYRSLHLSFSCSAVCFSSSVFSLSSYSGEFV